jgi:hypothetical protein
LSSSEAAVDTPNKFLSTWRKIRRNQEGQGEGEKGDKRKKRSLGRIIRELLIFMTGYMLLSFMAAAHMVHKKSLVTYSAFLLMLKKK